MRPLAVVEVQIPADRSARFAGAVIGPEVDLLVFDRAPPPLDKHVVQPSAAAVHADRDGLRQEETGEVGAGELAALVGVEDFRVAVLRQCLSSTASRAKLGSPRSRMRTRGQRRRICATIRTTSSTAPAEASMLERRSFAASRCRPQNT